jgi:hypothetical protein
MVEILDENKNSVLANIYSNAREIVSDFQMLTIYDIYNMTSDKNRNIYNKGYKNYLKITKL